MFYQLLQYKKQSHEFPAINHLDAQKGQFSQPIALNIVSNNTSWHLPLKSSPAKGIINTILDNSYSKNCNAYIFEDHNPESKQVQGRNRILKLQVIYSLHKLQGYTSQEIASKFQANQLYDRTFTLDNHGRIIENEFGMIDSSSSSKNVVNLDQCFEYSHKVDILKGADMYDCIKCNSKQEALKKNQIQKVPNVLMLTLQRFKNGIKNNELVDFPIRGFDLSKYAIVQDETMIYDLYGIVNHSGTLGIGHYTAKCYNEAEGRWLHYNDSHVSEIKSGNSFSVNGHGPDSKMTSSEQILNYVSHHLKQELVTMHAYVLFYKRRGFDPKTQEDFDALKVASTGEMDHMIKLTESS